MRTYRCTLTSQTVGTMAWNGLANWYDDAKQKAEAWANNHPDHGKHGPWVGSGVDVSA